MEIKDIQARQILDSRGVPTIEADVWLQNGTFGRASVPSGASTGSHEAHELRDGSGGYGGKSVHRAVDIVHKQILPELRGMRADDQTNTDKTMIELDGTENKTNLGANAILAVSLATAHAAAKAKGQLLYSHVNELAGSPEKSLPMPMMNLLNGGKHANNSTAIQEWMIIPKSSDTIAEAIETGAVIFSNLKKLLGKHGYTTSVGDEGGFTLPIKHYDTEALIFLSEACNQAGKKPGEAVVFAVDVAASELFNDGNYTVKAAGTPFDEQAMIAYLEELTTNFPIVSIEDGLAEDAWHGWNQLTQSIGGSIQIVGDDLLVTNRRRLVKAIEEKAANAILIKPNQIGTLTETIAAIMDAKAAGYKTIISHRSGETEDTSIVHIAVGTGAGQIKTGSMSRGERIAKYNELLRLEMIDSSLRLAQPF